MDVTKRVDFVRLGTFKHEFKCNSKIQRLASEEKRHPRRYSYLTREWFMKYNVKLHRQIDKLFLKAGIKTMLNSQKIIKKPKKKEKECMDNKPIKI